MLRQMMKKCGGVPAAPKRSKFPQSTMRNLARICLLLLSCLLPAAAFISPGTRFAVAQRQRDWAQVHHCSPEPHEAPVPSERDAVPVKHSRKSLEAAALGFVILSAAAASPALAEVPGWIAPTRTALDPLLIYMEFAFVCRIVLSWYPAIDLNKTPQNLVAWPTEPLLRPTRAVVPPAFGVDISPIVWVLILSFLREVLLGQQGVLTMIEAKG